jgi:hypothetical protein
MQLGTERALDVFFGGVETSALSCGVNNSRYIHPDDNFTPMWTVEHDVILILSMGGAQFGIECHLQRAF